MNNIIRCLIGLVSALLVNVGAAYAQDVEANSIESIVVAQQAGALNVKLSFKEPLSTLPPGFSVAKPARIAFDFANTTNGLGKNSLTYNEGDLKSVNVVQVDRRTRLVLNLSQAMSYEATLDGNNVLLVLSPSAKKDGMVAQTEHFSVAPAYQSTNISIRDIAFRRGRDGEARITVDLSGSNAGIDIKQQGQNLLVDFVKVDVPAALRKRMSAVRPANRVPW